MGKVWMPGGGGGADLDVVTAERPDILIGKVIVDKDGEPLTGTMPNRGAVNLALNTGESYSIPDGYHNGGGKVTANSLASQTVSNATAAQILTGFNAYVNGARVQGGIPLQNGQTITPGASQQTISCSGKYMTGNIIINGVRAYAWLSTQKATVGSRSFTNTDGNAYTLPYLSFAPGFTPIMYNAIISNGYVTSVSTPWETVFVGAGVNDNKGFYSRTSAPATALSLVIPVLNSGTYNVWIAGYY